MTYHTFLHNQHTYTWLKLESSEEIVSYGTRLGICVAEPSKNPMIHYEFTGSKGFVLALLENESLIAMTAYSQVRNALILIRRRFMTRLSSTMTPIVMDLLRAKDMGVHDVEGDFRAMGIIKISGNLSCVQELTEGQVVEGDLNLSNIRFRDENLPTDITIKGDLYLCKTNFPKVPLNWVVEGNLYAQFNTPKLELPSTLKVQGSIFL